MFAKKQPGQLRERLAQVLSSFISFKYLMLLVYCSLQVNFSLVFYAYLIVGLFQLPEACMLLFPFLENLLMVVWLCCIKYETYSQQIYLFISTAEFALTTATQSAGPLGCRLASCCVFLQLKQNSSALSEAAFQMRSSKN